MANNQRLPNAGKSLLARQMPLGGYRQLQGDPNKPRARHAYKVIQLGVADQALIKDATLAGSAS